MVQILCKIKCAKFMLQHRLYRHPLLECSNYKVMFSKILMSLSNSSIMLQCSSNSSSYNNRLKWLCSSISSSSSTTSSSSSTVRSSISSSRARHHHHLLYSTRGHRSQLERLAGPVLPAFMLVVRVPGQVGCA